MIIKLEEQIIDSDGEPLSKVTLDNGSVHYRDKDYLFHRSGGPAKIWLDGTQFYYQRDKLHRLDGPAIIGKDVIAYFIKDNRYTKEDYPKAVREYKLKQLVG